MTSSDEIWRDIPGYEGRYQASTLGRIRSLDRYVRCGIGGAGVRLHKGRILSPGVGGSDPYQRVKLGADAPNTTVHGLVAAAFLGPRPTGHEVLHLDGDPLNNRVSNLTYGLRAEKVPIAYRGGRAWKILTLEQIQDIRRRSEAGERGTDLAKEYGVSRSHITNIKYGRRVNGI